MSTAPNPEAQAQSEGLLAQIQSFNRVFWTANVMELVERFAYYGLRTVLPVYMVLAVTEGGPEFSHIQKGGIFAIWAAVQSFLPVFTGGYADRYGYKLTVGIAVGIKVSGYLLMAFAVDVANAMTGGVAGATPGHVNTYYTFMAGAVLLAAGTAIFKPGLQGIIALQVKEGPGGNASTGWALFYQLVNVGGFLGPFLASVMRLLAWKWVFISCAAIVCLNYFLLLTFAEPEQPPVDEAGKKDAEASFLRVFWNSLIGICEPRLMAFLVIFSGFWMMFYQLFDLLPNFIDDWVDSSALLQTIWAPIMGAIGIGIPEEWGGRVPQEQLININAGMIMLLAFVFGYITGKVRAMTAMMVGILISAAAIFGLGMSYGGWSCLGAIALFSMGEMLASPTKMRYFSSIAPPGKKGLYLGYVNATVGIGWSIGSVIAGEMYQTGGDKVVLARRYLVEELGQDAAAITDLAKEAVLPRLAQALGDQDVTHVLWTTYQPGSIWEWFAFVGVVSMIGLAVFDLVTRSDAGDREPYLLTALTAAVSFVTYGWGWALIFAGAMTLYQVLSSQAPQLLPQGTGEAVE